MASERLTSNPIIYCFIFTLITFSPGAFATNGSADEFCKNYDWTKVEKMVEPYLDDASYTALVMQGISAEYNTSVAAQQAIDSKLPDELYDVLSNIIKFNCP